MYDYISIHSNDYSKTVSSKFLEQYLIDNFEFEKISSLTFCKELYGERIILRGISAQLDGSYAYDTLEGIEEVNLIEIDVPVQIHEALEHAISTLAVAVSEQLSWIIDEDHGLS